MPEFQFEALTKKNEQHIGHITARSASEALEKLESQGLEVHTLRQTSSDEPNIGSSEIPPPLPTSDSQSPSASDDQYLRDRISQLMAQRDILAPALEAFVDEMPRGSRRKDLRKLASGLRSDATVDELCQSSNLAMTWLPLLGDGSALGSNRFLLDLLAETSRENEVRVQRSRVFAYPLIVLTIAILVLVFLSAVVVPTFSNIFDDFELDLPTLTIFIVRFSQQVQFHFGRLLLIGVGCLVAGYIVWRVLWMIELPGRLFDLLTTGSSRQLTEMAMFVRRLAESLNAGFPLPTALRLACLVPSPTTR